MIRTADLERLAAANGGRHGVLSVYLNLAPARQLRRSYRTAFNDLVKRLEEQLDSERRAAFQAEVARVWRYLDTEPPRGQGLALFSCAPLDLWQAYHLPVPVADDLRFGPTPYVGPLLDVLDEYERFAVALVDKEKARLFSVFMGEIEEERELFDVVPGRHDQGGWSQANYQRHHEMHVHWHLKRVAEALATLFRRRPFDRLVLAGPEEATSELRRLLPRPLRGRLVGTIPAETFMGEAEILRRTLEIERQLEREAEERIVGELAELTAAGGRATCGADATLDAIGQGEVRRLVVAEDTRFPGTECPQCGRLARAGYGAEAREGARCPLCGTELIILDDVVERATERVLDEKGTVEVVHAAAARRLMQECGGLGAFLRW